MDVSFFSKYRPEDDQPLADSEKNQAHFQTCDLKVYRKISRLNLI